jgi:hypothetical protein
VTWAEPRQRCCQVAIDENQCAFLITAIVEPNGFDLAMQSDLPSGSSSAATAA